MMVGDWMDGWMNGSKVVGSELSSVPMHVGVLTGPLCPLNSILSQGSSVPLIKFQITSRFRFPTSKGPKKGNSDRNV